MRTLDGRLLRKGTNFSKYLYTGYTGTGSYIPWQAAQCSKSYKKLSIVLNGRTTKEVILKPHSAYLAYPDGFIAGVLDAQWIEIVLWDLKMYRESICFEF